MAVVDMKSIMSGVVYEQLDYKVIFMQMRYATLTSFFQIDEEVQWQLDPTKRAELRDLLIHSLEQEMPFYFYLLFLRHAVGLRRMVMR